jgi:hypothetical protein
MLDRVTLIHGRGYEKFIERSDSMFNDYTTSDSRKFYTINRKDDKAPEVSYDKLILVDETNPDEIYEASMEIRTSDLHSFRPKLDTPMAFAHFYDNVIDKLDNVQLMPSILLSFNEKEQTISIGQMYNIYRGNMLLYTITFSTSEALDDEAADYVRTLFGLAKKFDDFYNIKYKFHLSDPNFSTIHILGAKDSGFSEALDYVYNDLLCSNL